MAVIRAETLYLASGRRIMDGMQTWRLGHRPALDGVRGLAILLVLGDHSGLLPQPIGVIGVTVFFVLSGFLITHVIAEARESGRWSMRSFMGNRAARLVPALVVMIAVMSVAMMVDGVGAQLVAERAAKAALYVQNFFAEWDRSSPFRHAWSLAVEEQFYLIWPLVFGWVISRRRSVRLLGWVVGVSLAARVALYLAGGHEMAYALLPTNAFALLLGCMLAIGRVTVERPSRAVAIGVVGLILTMDLAAPIPSDARWLVAPMLAAVAATALVAGAAHGSRVLEVLPLRFSGRISYALYLWHYPLLKLTGTYGDGWSAVWVLVLSVAVATASTLWLEEPVRRWWRARAASADAGHLTEELVGDDRLGGRSPRGGQEAYVGRGDGLGDRARAENPRHAVGRDVSAPRV